jgi:hypothetical protein
MDRRDRAIRKYALHLALMVRRRGRVLTLYDRKIGEYRTWAAVERAIQRTLLAQLVISSRFSR